MCIRARVGGGGQHRSAAKPSWLDLAGSARRCLCRNCLMCGDKVSGHLDYRLGMVLRELGKAPSPKPPSELEVLAGVNSAGRAAKTRRLLRFGHVTCVSD